MKFYKTEDKLIFGKYKEITLIEIAKKDQLYISWCAINLAHFYIDEKVISDMKEIVPSFKISQLAKDSFQSKYKEWLAEEENGEEMEKRKISIIIQNQVLGHMQVLTHRI